jgi:hypothetical protein
LSPSSRRMDMGEIERALPSAPAQHQEPLTIIQLIPKILTPARRRTRARSSRNPGRHHLGSLRRLRRNPQACLVVAAGAARVWRRWLEKSRKY